MGQTIISEDSDPDAEEDFAGREGEGEESTDGVMAASDLEDFVPEEEQDGLFEGDMQDESPDDYPGDGDMESLWEERSEPGERGREEGAGAEGEPAAGDESEALSAAERARPNGVSQWRNEEVLEPTPEELEGDEAIEAGAGADADAQAAGGAASMEGAGVRDVADVGDDVENLLGEDSPEPEAAEPELKMLDEPDTGSSVDSDPTTIVPTPAERGDVPDDPAGDVTVETVDGDTVAVDDPDGYAAKYSAADQTVTPDEPADEGSFAEDLPGAGRMPGTQENKRPGLDPNPEGSEDFQTQLNGIGGSMETGDTLTDAGDPAAGLGDSPEEGTGPGTGNQTKAKAMETSRDASRPTSFDQEYGLSAKGSDNPHWKGDDNMTAMGGIPAAPDDNYAGEVLDEDHWELPASTVSEMQEQFMVAEAEVLNKHDKLEQRHGGELDEQAGRAEAARARGTRRHVTENTDHQTRPDPDEAWDEYEPYTQTQTVGGEEVDVAIGGNAPQVPTEEYNYDPARGERIYQSFSDTLQENIDDRTADIANKSSHLDQREVRNEFVKQMELGSGTIGTDDIEIAKEVVNDPSRGASTQEAIKRAKGAALSGEVQQGYTTQKATQGTVGVRDVPDMLDYWEDTGYNEYSDYEEARGDVEGVVSGTVEAPATNSGVDQVVYVSPKGEMGSDTQLKVTVWDSGENTTERAASNNAERDASGRTMDQTKGIPNMQTGDEITVRDAKLAQYGTTPTAQIDREANVDLEDRSRPAELGGDYNPSDDRSSGGDVPVYNSDSSGERKSKPDSVMASWEMSDSFDDDYTTTEDQTDPDTPSRATGNTDTDEERNVLPPEEQEPPTMDELLPDGIEYDGDKYDE